MSQTEAIRVAVPRKGRPLEAVLERVADVSDRSAQADEIISTLRHEKAITKGQTAPAADVYQRLATYSDLDDDYAPEYTLLRDQREGMPRRIVFDSLTVDIAGIPVQFVGREEPFRALRTHEFALGFDSADLVLEEVVELRADPVGDLEAVNERIDPMDTDVRLRTGLGDTVYHTLLSTPDVLPSGETPLDRSFVSSYTGSLCVSPRYERLVEAVLGTDALDGIEFVYPESGQTEERAIANAGLGVYLTVTGSTARDHGLVVGESLFPSETVLLENEAERTDLTDAVAALVAGEDIDTELPIAQ